MQQKPGVQHVAHTARVTAPFAQATHACSCAAATACQGTADTLHALNLWLGYMCLELPGEGWPDGMVVQVVACSHKHATT